MREIVLSSTIKKMFNKNNPISNVSKWNFEKLMKTMNIKERSELVQLSSMTLHLLKSHGYHYLMEDILIVSTATHKWFNLNSQIDNSQCLENNSRVEEVLA